MISQFSLQHFCGIEAFCAHFSEKNILIGPNGSGKTHMLDALHLLGGSRPLYAKKVFEPGARIEIFFQEENRKTPYSMSATEKGERFFIQTESVSGKKYRQNLPFRTVFISPFDMNILYFAPEIRRSYLDDILTRSYEQFASVKKEYELLVRSRNRLLKMIREGRASREDLNIWDKKIAQNAATYGLYRKKYIDFVNETIRTLPDFFGKYSIEIAYTGDWLYEEDPVVYIQTSLQTHRERDILSGHTHIGPHRDDFILTLARDGDRQNVQFFLSRGEMKMLLLGLKLIEADFIQKQTKKKIVLLIDDIFAELDEENIQIFLKVTIQHQIFLTSQKYHPDTDKTKNFTCVNCILG